MVRGETELGCSSSIENIGRIPGLSSCCLGNCEESLGVTADRYFFHFTEGSQIWPAAGDFSH